MAVSAFGHIYFANRIAAQGEVKRIASAVTNTGNHATISGFVDDVIGVIWKARQELLPDHYRDILNDIDKFLEEIVEGSIRIPLRICVYQNLLELNHLLDNDRIYYLLTLARLYLEERSQGLAIGAAQTALRLINNSADSDKTSQKQQVATIIAKAMQL